MADNFDLRQFLTENKLTKNAQLISELNLADVPEAIDLPGVTGQVTVVFYSEHGMGEAEIEVMSVQEALALLRDDAGGGDDEAVEINTSDIDQQGDLNPETEGLTCVLEVAIEGHGTYEVYQGSNDLKEASRSMKNKMNEEAPIQGLNLVVLDDYEGGDITLEKYSDMDDEFQQIFSDGLESGEWEATSLEQGLAELDEYFEERGDPSQQENYNTKKQQFQSAVQGKAGKFYVHGVEYDLQLMFIEGQEGEESIDEAAPASMQAGFDMVSQQKREHADMMRIANKLFPQHGGNLVNFKPLSREERDQVYAQYAKELKRGVRETVKENKMTQRDKYLTRLVENALGLTNNDEDQEFDPGHDIEQAQHNIERQYEGEDYGTNAVTGKPLPKPDPIVEDEMVEEKPLPKYENIEKLMQEIEKNTDEESHKFKIAEMKRVADGLEKKATALEEGDNAEHIDMKKLKQMKKDVMTLRKNIDKLEKVGEKKFAKKEQKAEIKEGFDLRKFLVENKLTSNSKLLKEDREIQFVTDFQGGGHGHGEEYSAVVGYEKGDNVIFKLGDAGFDGVPSTVVIMPNSNIYHALKLFADQGYDVEQNKIKLDSENEYAVDDMLDALEDKGLVHRFDPEMDIQTKEDVDKYNSYLPEDEQYSYEDFGLKLK